MAYRRVLRRIGWLFIPALVAACGAEPSAPRPGADVGPGAPAAAEPLLDDLGTHHRAITTRCPLAQRYFDQGFRLLYSFNQEEARRSFEQAAALDPSCAMCSWGVAAALGPNINIPRLPEFAEPAARAAREALRLAPGASPVERALIEAMARRYSPSFLEHPADRRALDLAYAEAMRDAARRFPDDADVQTLFAESLMVLYPWDYWTKDGGPRPATPEIVATLERVLEAAPEHPGANHYYIHALEASPHPERALPSADRLGALIPGNGHIVHMPSHIYLRLGRYHDASLANERAVAVDRAHAARVAPGPIWSFYTAHNLNFLSASRMMEGRSEDALAAARSFAREMSLDALRHMSMMDTALSFASVVLVRFGRWEAMLEEPAPPPGFRYPTAIWRWARGVALANLGRLDEAEAELARVTSARDATPGDEIKGLNSARVQLDIASTVLRADIAEKRGDREGAIAWLRGAAQAEDDLRYFEPPDWYPPVRHQLGATLLAAGRAGQAEAVYREDLARSPDNGWSLFGLAASLSAQGKIEEASQARSRFERAWAWADVRPTSSRF